MKMPAGSHAAQEQVIHCCMLEIGQCRRAVRVCLPAARCYCRPPCLFSIRGRRRAAVEAGKAAESGPSTGAGADGFAGPTALTTSAGASSDSASVDAAAGVDEGGVSASAEAGCAIPAVSLSESYCVMMLERDCVRGGLECCGLKERTMRNLV
ncbi:hypothetical protein NDU88_004675 [Pleurodeles waltl]|uniref:Uncharacterized protein n=1 Tax=Pleurodeles waltl TaxID=8319 RepID=A0AAV7UFX5_PLEWA|nr:hypothetical protein NDU88_004675 [Pleurodeles waltl]